MKKVKLGEVTINIDNRRKPLNNLQRSEKSFSKKYPYCGANNIIDFIDEYIFDENEEILCIAEDGGNWGKDEECTYVMNEKCWVNNHAHVLKMKTGVDINYIKLILDYLDLTPYITGSTRGKLTKSSLDKIEINLPNYHTQISISKKISDIQKLITKKEEQIQKYNELVKSRFNEMFGDLLLNEFKWDYASFNEFAKFDTKMIYDFTNFIDLPHIGIDSIEKNTGKLIGYRTVREDQISSGKYLFTKKHIIYSKIRPNLNKVALPDFMGVCSADAYPILTVEEKMNRIFLAHVLRSDYFLNFILSFSSRTNLPKVNKSQISKFVCPLPPLSLQNEFADFVAQVDKSQLAIQKSLEELETLKKSLMQEYFG